VPVRDEDGKEYVVLGDVLQPLGGSVATNDARVRFRLANASGECEDGKSKCKIAGNNTEMSSKVMVRGDDALVPRHSLPSVLTGLMDVRFDFHENTRRMFLGNYGNNFKTEAKKVEQPSVAFQFNAPVNPSISTEPGKLRMVFARDGVNSGVEQFKF